VDTPLAGIALTSPKPEQREQAERLLDLILDGLSPGGHHETVLG
jgi:hypothetical protein